MLGLSTLDGHQEIEPKGKEEGEELGEWLERQDERCAYFIYFVPLERNLDRVAELP